jgi:hypothetical protein
MKQFLVHFGSELLMVYVTRVQPELNIVQVSKLNIVHTEIMKYDTELKFASF